MYRSESGCIMATVLWTLEVGSRLWNIVYLYGVVEVEVEVEMDVERSRRYAEILVPSSCRKTWVSFVPAAWDQSTAHCKDPPIPPACPNFYGRGTAPATCSLPGVPAVWLGDRSNRIVLPLSSIVPSPVALAFSLEDFGPAL